MLAVVVNERQDDWDLRLPHVEFAYNNSDSAATSSAPNEVVGPALQTGTAKPTAFTAGCGLVWHSVSSPGTTGNIF